MLMLIAEYAPTIPVGETRTRLLNGRVRGWKAGLIQKLTVSCEWATLEEIRQTINRFFPGVETNNSDVTGVFFLDGDPSIEPVSTKDLYVRNAVLSGSAWYPPDSPENPPELTYEYGSLEPAP